MIEVLGGENYFIDLDEIEKYVDMTEHDIKDSSGSTETRINIVKFEISTMSSDI